MVSAYILFGGLVATFACISVFFTVFIVRGAKYKELSDPDYSRLTLGNPLTALFIERLLTHEGLRFRSTFCTALIAIWVVVFVAGIIASNVG
jgi:hypothetical protein